MFVSFNFRVMLFNTKYTNISTTNITRYTVARLALDLSFRKSDTHRTKVGILEARGVLKLPKPLTGSATVINVIH